MAHWSDPENDLPDDYSRYEEEIEAEETAQRRAASGQVLGLMIGGFILWLGYKLYVSGLFG